MLLKLSDGWLTKLKNLCRLETLKLYGQSVDKSSIAIADDLPPFLNYAGILKDKNV